VKDTVDELSKRGINGETADLVNGQTPGLLSFAPVPPANDNESDRNPFENQLVNGSNASFNGTHLRHMKDDIDMLKERERLHTHQYNNLITDNVVEMMVNVMNKQYPDAKNAQAAVDMARHDLNTLRETSKNEFKVLQDSVIALQNNFDANIQANGLRTESTDDGTTAVKDEAIRLRNELNELSVRVQRQGQAIDAGNTRMEGIAADLKEAKKTQFALDGRTGQLFDKLEAFMESETNETG
jgi:hypothetical protein